MSDRFADFLREDFAYRIREGGRLRALVRKDFAAAFDALGLGEDGSLAPPPDAVPVEAGGRGAAFTVPGDQGGEAILRLYRRGGLVGRVLERRYLAGHRSLLELEATERLRRRGAPVPEPLAAVELRRWIGYEAAILTRRLAGARTLAAVLRDGGTPAGEVLEAAGRAVGALHAAGGYHADLNAWNLLALPEPTRFVVIDLDRALVAAAPLPETPAVANLQRLRRSLAKLGHERALETWPAFERGYRRAREGEEAPGRDGEPSEVEAG